MLKPIPAWMAVILFGLSSVAACSLTSLDYLKTGSARDAADLGDSAGSGGVGGAPGDTGAPATANDADAADVAADLALGAGGSPGSGGVLAEDSASTGGIVATGGQSAAGGVVAGGGARTGGSAADGGGAASGGIVATGGRVATGGAATSGGQPASGGVARTGGATGAGGVVVAGGANATGGASGTGGCSACAHAIDLTGESPNPLRGSPGAGTAYKDRCPANQAIIGYSGTLRNDVYSASGVPVVQISSVQAVCGTLSVSQAGQVTVSSQGNLVQRGNAGAAGNWSRMCPTNEVVVSSYGHAGVIVDQLGFVCAGLTGTISGCTFTLAIGKTSNLDPAGGTGGTAFSDQCPAGTVAGGQSLYAEKWVDSLGLLCSAPTPAAACGP